MNTKLKLIFLSLSCISISTSILPMGNQYTGTKRFNPFADDWKAGRKAQKIENEKNESEGFYSSNINETNRKFHQLALLNIDITTKKKQIAALLKNHDINYANPVGENVLHRVIKANNMNLNHKIELVQFLVSQGADVNKKEVKLGVTPLHLAAGRSSELLKLLLNNNYHNINIQTNNGQTPLHWALGADMDPTEKLKIVTLVINKGARVDLPLDNGITPLHLATSTDPKILRILLKTKDYNVNIETNTGTPLQHAVNAKISIDTKKEMVKLLLKAGASVDQLITEIDKVGSVLHYAALEKDANLYRILLEHNQEYDIDVLDSKGQTPLY